MTPGRRMTASTECRDLGTAAGCPSRSWSALPSGLHLRTEEPCLAPVDDEIALGEVPTLVDLGERVEVAERRDYELADAVFAEHVVRDRVALAGGVPPVDRDRALAVEVGGDLVALEVLEDGRERLPPFEHVGRLASLTFYVDGEAGVGREEGLLPLGVAAVGAVRVGVEELAQGEPVRSLTYGWPSYSD